MSVDPSVTFAGGEARPLDGGKGGGAAGSEQIRIAPHGYTDADELAGADRPNPRFISNTVFKQTNAEGEQIDRPTKDGTNGLFWAWGQFIDHDMVQTANSASAGTAPVPVPNGDPVFANGSQLPFSRSTPIDGTGTSLSNPRDYPNQVTSFLDGSMIYGTDAARLAAILEPNSAKLKLTGDGTIGFATGDPVLRNGPVTGDGRANENVALLSMHALFAREHNRLVDELREADPTLTRSELFAGARARIEAMIQAITWNEYLPRLLGKHAIEKYEGFRSDVNPAISIEFSTGVFRFGHSMLDPTIERLNESGTTHALGNLQLRDAFNTRGVVEKTGIAAILRGMAATRSQSLDTFVIEDVRSMLFGQGGPGSDLVALNIQRGRDHGLPSYNEMREALGLEARTSFAQITTDTAVVQRLRAAYGHVDKLDLWVGGLAEDAVGGGLVGETFRAVLIDQFTRLRDGDPFWSEDRGFSRSELRELWSTTLADVIRRNTDVEVLQDDAFAALRRFVGGEGADALVGSALPNLMAGLGGDDFLRGGSSADEMHGGPGDDLLRGNAGADRIFGGSGADRLNGGAGADALYGGRGPDVFTISASDAIADRISGGHGVDTVSVDPQFGAIHLANTRLMRSIERFDARGQDILGTPGDDRLDFRVFDEVAGLAAARGGSGGDRIWGCDAADRLFGGRGDDRLHGGAGRDQLYGGRGADLLEGGAGADLLRGGSGADTFRFRARTADGRDVIEDFDAGGGDRVELKGYDFGSERPGRLSDGQKFAAVMDATDFGHKGAVIDLDDLGGTGSILLEGIRDGDLSRDDFLFG